MCEFRTWICILNLPIPIYLNWTKWKLSHVSIDRYRVSKRHDIEIYIRKFFKTNLNTHYSPCMQSNLRWKLTWIFLNINFFLSSQQLFQNPFFNSKEWRFIVFSKIYPSTFEEEKSFWKSVDAFGFYSSFKLILFYFLVLYGRFLPLGKILSLYYFVICMYIALNGRGFTVITNPPHQKVSTNC